jgi:hypothetical protein
MMKKLKRNRFEGSLLKTIIAAILFLSFIVYLTFLFSDVYGFSPKLKTEFLSKEIQNYIYYGLTDDSSNKTLNYLQQSSELDRVYISSNGTHLEIKFLFNDFLDKLKNAILNSTTAPQNLFINIFVDSDHDETTGFLGYNYRYLLTHDNSNSYNDTKLNSPTNTTNFSRFTQNQSNHTEILDNEELQEIITRTINSKDLIEKLNWNIRGYELLDYDFQPLFFSSKLTKKYLSVIPSGFKVTLDLAQIGYPTNYAVLVEVGRKSEDYKFSHVFGKIHVPHPDLNLEVKSIDINNGKNSVVLEFNNTGLYKLNMKAELLKKDFSDDNLSINFSQGNHFTLLGGKGVIPIDIIANSNYHQKNIVVPLNLSYSVIGENDFIESSFNNSLTNENIYNKIFYLNLNLIDERNRLINFDEIPSEYIAIFVGAVFSFFIPTITKSTKEYFQKRTANKYLKNILKEQNLSDNPDISIKRVMSILRILKYEYIRGKISKDQYDILKENIGDVIKDLMSKSDFRR